MKQLVNLLEICFHSESEAGRLMRFASLRWCFASNRRLFDWSVGLVLRRTLVLSDALRINLTSRSNASWRFRSWVRNRCACIISTPSSVILLPARLTKRLRTSSGRDGELALFPFPLLKFQSICLLLFYIRKDKGDSGQKPQGCGAGNYRKPAKSHFEIIFPPFLELFPLNTINVYKYIIQSFASTIFF